jgi:hypothetical protein
VPTIISSKEFERLKSLVSGWVQEPTTMPWGNRSILFRDPDGNPVNLFAPSPRTRSRGSGSRRAEPKPPLVRWLSMQVWREGEPSVKNPEVSQSWEYLGLRLWHADIE